MPLRRREAPEYILRGNRTAVSINGNTAIGLLNNWSERKTIRTMRRDSYGMKANKNINYMKYALVAVWSAVLLLLGGCSKTEEGTWKQEYENCMAVMEQGISDRGMAGGQDLLDYERNARDNTVIYWQDSLNAFGECVEACIRNLSGSMAGEENVYRTATLLMAVTCEEHNGSYKFVYEHEEDIERIQEDFKAVIEGENPIDESMDSLREDFGCYYYADTLTSEMMAEAWQKEFYHCLDLERDRVKQSNITDKEQILEVLKAWEDFFEEWAVNESRCKWQEFRYEKRSGNEGLYEWLRSGGGLCIWQAESEARIFRTGTLLLIDGVEQSGGSYAFIYEEEPDRQELIKQLGIHPDTEEGTWKQEYEICLAAMKLGISRYDVTGADIPYENLPDFEKRVSDRSMELWQDSLIAFDEYVTVCIRNQTGGIEGEEEFYRMAVLLMKTLCESRNGHYMLVHGHGEDPERAQEDFKGVIEKENPIDGSSKLFYEEFGSFYYSEFVISEMAAKAWQEEFHHCLDTVKDKVKQSDTVDQKQMLEALNAWEDFFVAWADNEDAYEWIEGGTGVNIARADRRAEVFRIGTMLLIEGLKSSGGSYEFIYDSEQDRQYLIKEYYD